MVRGTALAVLFGITILGLIGVVPNAFAQSISIPVTNGDFEVPVIPIYEFTDLGDHPD